MDTSAGISLRPSASLLCALNGGDPVVVARATGYRDAPPVAAKTPEAPRRGGLAGLLGKLVGAKPAADITDAPFPFERAGELLRDLMIAAPPEAPIRVAVAVPAWANDVQRHDVAHGARAAGWDLLGLVNEPIAAAMASGLLHQGDGTVLVYDLSDDHFDVTIIAFHDINFEVLAADGLPRWSDGTDLSQRLLQTEAPCSRARQYAGLQPGAIDTVILVGESGRAAKTIDHVTSLFGKAPLTRFDPEEVTGFGAAVHASILERR